VATKPVLHSTTKIAGAARAARFSGSRFICGSVVPDHMLCGKD
jgi:hypothetical protein